MAFLVKAGLPLCVATLALLGGHSPHRDAGRLPGSQAAVSSPESPGVEPGGGQSTTHGQRVSPVALATLLFNINIGKEKCHQRSLSPM